MIAFAGNLLLWVAVAVALLQAVVPWLPIRSKKFSHAHFIRFATTAVFVAMAGAFGALVYAFAISDFSLLLVATNSHTAKPLIYKISGTWGNHEGSMLLYIFFISIISQIISIVNLSKRFDFYYKLLSIQGIIILFLLIYLILASNPFLLLPFTPPQGMGLNPLLQDVGLAMHPPMLYLGYVGFTVAFSFAVVGLLQGKVDGAWAKALRPWVTFTLVFLTTGIALGSWWAYRELGWGGFWFWDPVENSSLLPWLAGVALLHSLLVLEKRGFLAGWSCLLGILTYALGLMGFFLVRSGILTSVHSFANDPQRGVFILAIITLLVGSALFLFGLRGPLLRPKKADFQPISRENLLRVNNLLLLVLCFTVALGTLYPIFLELLTGAKISVGAPYFNATFNQLAVILLLLAAFAPALAWKKGKLPNLVQRHIYSLLIAIAAAGYAVWRAPAQGGALTICGVGLSVWLAASMVEDALRRSELFRKKLPRSYYAMAISHIGVGMLALGISVACGWALEAEQLLKPGQKMEMGKLTITFDGTELSTGKNYVSDGGKFTVYHSGKARSTLHPERRFYPVESQQTTESAIYYSLCGDVYIALGEPDGAGGYGVRVYVKPLMWLIWCGAATISLGLALSLGFRRGIIKKALRKPEL